MRQIACCLLAPLFCSAQQNKVVVHPAEPVAVKRGSVVVQTLDVSILPGLHVNSDKPKDEFLIPFKLTWTSGPLEAQEVTYPEPEEISVGSQRLAVFTGKFKIVTKFKAAAGATPGPGPMVGKLRYQACNSEMCFRPASLEVHVPVTIE